MQHCTSGLRSDTDSVHDSQARTVQLQWAAMQQPVGAQATGNGSRKRSTVLRIIAAAAAHSGAEEAQTLTIDLLKVVKRQDHCYG